MTTNALRDGAFWADVQRRAGRQLVQVLTPALVVLAAGHGLNLDAIGGLGWIAAIAIVITTLKAWYGRLQTNPDDLWWLQAFERAAGAVVAVLAGYTFAGPLTDLLQLPWAAIGWSCLGAAGLAVAAMVTNPPTRADHALAA